MRDKFPTRDQGGELSGDWPEAVVGPKADSWDEKLLMKQRKVDKWNV